jgi:tRNA(fMet)-specific endonuclease VapC
MILDTNIVIQHIRKQKSISSRGVIPIVVVGELQAFALKADWGVQKVMALNEILEKLPIADINTEIVSLYAKIDAFSQNKLKSYPLPENTPRNMGKNDIWIAAIALYYDIELWTTDNDFSHLVTIGLKISKKLI